MRNAFAILLVLAAVAIMLLLMLTQMSAFFGTGRGSEKIDYYAARPWFEEDRLKDDEDFPIAQTGKNGQTVIEEQTVLHADVFRKDELRGKIEITLTPAGRVYGTVSMQYEYTDSSYTITAEFRGNIDPTKIFESSSGKNKKLLYFIAKGKYQQTKINKADNTQWQTLEPVYVVGWLRPDFSASGKMFLMLDDTNSNAEYDWNTN